MKTHKGKHSFGIVFPTVYHPLVLFNNPIKIHREYSFRTIGRVGILLRTRSLSRLCLGRIYRVIYRGRKDEPGACP